MRYGEDDYGNNGGNPFLEDFAVYGANPEASAYRMPTAANLAVTPQASSLAVMPTAAQPAPMATFSDDDYTGRMGPDGEPERYSTMPGGDPRVRQQQEIAERERRLQEPFSIDNWLKSANKDVRGTTAASQITLNPGTQYRIRDYSGRNDGQIIASGSTPEEFLMMQDVARGLARQGRNADYRLEQVGGQAAENFGQYQDPDTGEAVSIIGGDLYNKPIAGEIIKIAAPIALQFIPGLGTALGANLGLSGLAAKAAGVGLTSALGRTGAGVLTGEKVGDALKAGAVSGLASGATAGLLGATGVDKAIGSALGGTKGALAGEAAAQGVGQAAASFPGEIVVSAARNALAPTILGGLGAAGGSLLGDVGQSLAQADPYQQALEQARMQNQFAPTAPPMAPEDILEVVGQRGTGAVPGTGALAGATSPLLDSTLNDIMQQYEQPQMAETPAEDEILVSNTATPDVDLSGLSALGGAATGGFDQFLSDNAGMIGGEQPQMAETPAEDEILVSNTATPKVDLSGLSALSGAAVLPGTAASLELPGEELIDVAASRTPDAQVSDILSGGAGALATAPVTAEEMLLEAIGKRFPDTQVSDALSGGAGTILSDLAVDTTLPGEELIDVAAKRTPDAQLDSALAGAAGALTTAAPVTDPGEIVVTGQKNKPAEINAGLPVDLLAPVAGEFAVADIVGGGQSLEQEQAEKDSDKKGSVIPKVIGGLTLLDLLLKALGGGGGGNTATGGAGKLNPIFSAKLPSRGSFLPNADLSPRDMSGVDWKRYGFGPEKSFFNYVPATNDEYKAMLASPRPSFSVQGAGTSGGAGGSTSTAAAPSYRFAGRTEADVLRELAPDATEEQLAAYLETEEGKNVLSQIRANTGPTEKRARGGSLAVKKGGAPAKESFAVKGPGTGRSDEIPALLSDGEYVIDAETVAMLGDGSSEAGAKRLDDFRVNIRKHKGRNLAKGKFSANAKAPERYLSGGRVK